MRINEYIPINGKFFDRAQNEDQFYPLATRRPRLTLRHLNKLRKQRELRKVEKLKQAAAIIDIYRTPEDPDDKKKNRRKKDD